MIFPDSRILIFCKAPYPGKVKMRLQPDISAEKAADIHMELTRRILSLVVENQLCPVELWCHPDSEHDFFQECQKEYPITCCVQYGNDLGERMHNAFRKTLENSHSAILVGCDCPSLLANDFELGFKALSCQSDVVIAPTEDGGYGLIGLRAEKKELFENICWGSSSVYTETKQKIVLQKLACDELSMQWDVDRYEDYQRYCKVFSR